MNFHVPKMKTIFPDLRNNENGKGRTTLTIEIVIGQVKQQTNNIHC